MYLKPPEVGSVECGGVSGVWFDRCSIECRDVGWERFERGSIVTACYHIERGGRIDHSVGECIADWNQSSCDLADVSPRCGAYRQRRLGSRRHCVEGERKGEARRRDLRKSAGLA